MLEASNTLPLSRAYMMSDEYLSIYMYAGQRIPDQSGRNLAGAGGVLEASNISNVIRGSPGPA